MLDTQTQLYLTTVLRIQPQTGCIRTLDLAIPERYPDFRPGQIVEIQVEPAAPQSGLSTGICKRHYAICSQPSDRSLRICVDLVNVKGVSGSLFQLNEGDCLNISLPGGNFGLALNASAQPTVFVGFGAGIGVIRGLSRQYFNQRAAGPAQLYAINSGETAIPYEKELASDSEQYAGLDVFPILLPNGYDTDEILDRLVGQTVYPERANVYLAGPSAVLQDLTHGLVDMGFAEEKIRSEQFL